VSRPSRGVSGKAAGRRRLRENRVDNFAGRKAHIPALSVHADRRVSRCEARAWKEHLPSRPLRSSPVTLGGAVGCNQAQHRPTEDGDDADLPVPARTRAAMERGRAGSFLGLPVRNPWAEGATGFEPVLREDDDGPSLGREPGRPASELPADLQRIVERLTKRRGARELGD
jgi:hypothetical protein